MKQTVAVGVIKGTEKKQAKKWFKKMFIIIINLNFSQRITKKVKYKLYII
jgi:hypothetical protein